MKGHLLVFAALILSAICGAYLMYDALQELSDDRWQSEPEYFFGMLLFICSCVVAGVVLADYGVAKSGPK